MALEDLSLPGMAPGGMETPVPGGDEAEAAPDQSKGRYPGETDQTKKLRRWSDLIQTPNIAEEILEEENGENRLSEIGMRVSREYEVDNRSRSEWLDQSKKAMDLAMQVASKKTFPWDGASNVIYPLVTVGAIQFAARAYPGIVDGRNVVKGVVTGDDSGVPAMGPDGQPVTGPDGKPQWAQGPDGQAQRPGAKRAHADKIAEHMSWQLIEEQDEWEEDTDRLLHVLPIVGCVFKKTFFDASLGRNRSVMVAAENVVINYWAKSLQTAPRITEEIKLYPVEIEERIRSGLFVDQDYMPPNTAGDDEDAPREFLEQHRLLDLDEDGYPEPYVVTIEKDSMKVARIAARYDPDGIHFARTDNQVQLINPVHYYTKFDFMPNPRGAIYGVGFGQILKPLNESVNTAINQLFDAGSLQNTGGGFVGRGLSMHSGQVKFRLGEWKVINSPGADIRNAIVPLNHPGPSDTLFKLLGLLVEAGKEISSVKDVLSGDQPHANIPATSLLAMIEQGLKVFTGIWKRTHRSLKHEYEKLYRLNRIYLEEQSSYRIGDIYKTITRKDYLVGAGVIPWSDPNMVTDMQRLGRANILQMFINDPLFDGMEIRRRMLEAANIENIERLLQDNPSANPMLQFKKAELGMKQVETKAQAIYHLARGYQALAMGDKAIGDAHLNWLVQHMQMLQADLDNMNDFDQPHPPPAPDEPNPFAVPPAPLPTDPPGVGNVRINMGMGSGFGGR